MGDVRVGTASWTDPGFIRAGWYPPEVKADAEARLRYYAERFPMVEVNASFYALPAPQTTAAWAARTPPGFRFHVKAHQVISGHACDPGRLPPARYDAQGRNRRPGRMLRDAVVDALLQSVEPLGDKLGAVLVQLAPHVAAGDAERAEVGRILARLAPVRGAVEFRHRSWAAAGQRERTAELLAHHDAAWVAVDAPRIDHPSAMPPIVEVTTPSLAYLRMHGRNGDMWTAGRSVAERFHHTYTTEELEEWVGPVLDMADRAREVAAVFNNNAEDFALRSAAEFRQLVLERAAGG